MSNQDNFSQAEWDVLTLAPVMIGVAVAAASADSDGTTQREMSAINHVLQQPSQQAESTELIGAVVAGIQRRPSHDFDPAEVSLEVLDVCRQVSSILLAKQKDPQSGVGANEAARFKDWLMIIGNRVAEAANTGKLPGFKAHSRVSDSEVHVLEDIAGALNEITSTVAGSPAPAPEAEPGRDSSAMETMTVQLSDALPPRYAEEELQRRSREADENRTPFD